MNTYEDGPPRNPDWELDGIGINRDGHVILRDGRSVTAGCRMVQKSALFQVFEENEKLKYALEDAERLINARHPDRFVPEIIAVMEARRLEAAKLASVGGVAGGIMSGQRQAYADAAATLRDFIEARPR